VSDDADPVGRADDEAVAPVVDTKPDRKKALVAIGVAIVVLVIVFGVIFPQLVDWDAVFEALGEVDGAELLVIAVLAVVRYLPAGWIYSLVLPGLSVRRGTEAWVATTAVSTTLPGFDLVLRIAMYASWGFGIERATSGMFLSGVVEMTTKLIIAIAAVTIGALIMSDLALLAVAGIALLVVLAVAGVVAAVLRSEERARSVGERVQRLIVWGSNRLGRQAPEDIIDRILSVRLEAREVLGSRWPQAFLRGVHQPDARLPPARAGAPRRRHRQFRARLVRDPLCPGHRHPDHLDPDHAGECRDRRSGLREPVLTHRRVRRQRPHRRRRDPLPPGHVAAPHPDRVAGHAALAGQDRPQAPRGRGDHRTRRLTVVPGSTQALGRVSDEISLRYWSSVSSPR
jgi:hypothetical protein